MKLFEFIRNTKKQAFDKVRKQENLRQNEKTRKNVYEKDLKTLLEDTFKKYIPQHSLQNSTLLTKCEKCGHVGLNFLTSSTKENFSPRFLDKIRQLLPTSTIKKSLSEVSTLPISEYYPDSSLISPFKDNFRDTLSNFSPDFCGNGKIKIPKLNISDVLPSNPRYSEEVLKGSPIKKINEAFINSAVLKLSNIFKLRVHRSFDMIFLSRANHQTQEESLTFEFTLEESKISNEPSTLTGTFGDNNKFFEISGIHKKKDDSFSIDCSDN